MQLTTWNPKTTKPYLAESECPEDGGHWALYCEHLTGTGVLQDTNKRRLAQWLKEPEGWCTFCRENH